MNDGIQNIVVIKARPRNKTIQFGVGEFNQQSENKNINDRGDRNGQNAQPDQLFVPDDERKRF